MERQHLQEDRDSDSALPSPRLSVVMPAYQAERFVGRAIESVLGQTIRDLELVVIDDGSNDGTWDTIQAYASRDARVSAYRNERNMGITSTLNRGVSLARAPLIGRMDADDISLPDRFEKQLDFLRRNPTVAVVGSFVAHTNEEEAVLSLSQTGPTTVAEFEQLRRVGEPTLVFGGTALFSKELFERVGGYNTDLVSAEELDLFDRMAEYGPILAIPEPLLLYRLHPHSNVMRTFHEGRTVHRYVARRRRARTTGEPFSMTLEEYRRSERSMPAWRRFRMWQQDRAQFDYRRAAVAFAQGNRVATALHLGRAAITNPAYVVRRLWHQRLSSRARSTRNRQET
jgi:glycosyltransferase involved in cell wall biosynthesis